MTGCVDYTDGGNAGFVLNTAGIYVDAKANHMYVTEVGNRVLVCSDLLLSNCTASPSSFASPYSLSIYNDTGYVLNNGANTVSVCTELSDMSNCTDVPGFTTPFGITIANDLAYISSWPGNQTGNASISICRLPELTNCSVVYGFSGPNTVAVAGTTMYVPNRGNSTISVCRLTPDGFNVESCTQSLADNTLVNPTSVFFWET